MKLIRPMLGLALGLAAAPAMAQTPRLLPVPAEMHAGEGSFAISAATPIVVAADDAGARNAAERFADYVKATRGLSLAIRTAPAKNAIRFVRGGGAGDEAYTLAVGGDGATITAASDSGLLYGGVTLWQAMTQDAGKGAITVPGLSVTDAPRFHWRGLMLDSARHFQSVGFIHQMLDWMAANKLNTFHWHLVDDQAWRIPIPKYPKLTTISAWRHPATAPGAPQLPAIGGFYTHDQIREIVAYAQKRGITIIPEIEMPGHALAAIRAYPELGTGTPWPAGTESDFGVFPWLYNTDEHTFLFLQDVLTQVMELFPSKYIHVGGDEAVKVQWKASAKIQAQMKSLGIKDETAMQAWFVHRIGEFLKAHGRKLIGWDEILEGDVPADATITSWRGIEGAITAAKSGHDAVLSPAPTLYLDNRQGFGPNEPPGRGTLIDLKRVYDFDPVPDEIPADARHHVLGLQGNLWTEHTATEARAAWEYYPRASAIAETGWSREEGRSYPDFITRLAPQMARMKGLGLNAATSAFTVTPVVDYTPGEASAQVTLATQSGLPIRYTLDGTAPVAASPTYAAPVAVPLGQTLRAATFLDDAAQPGAITRRIDAASVRTRTDEELQSCNNKVVIAVEDDWPAAQSKRAHFLVDIFDPCWNYAKAPVGGAKKIAVEVGNIPFNWQIGDDINHIKLPVPANPDGEIQVFAGKCEGTPIAVLPLTPALHNPGITRLIGDIAPQQGVQNLCIRAAFKNLAPFWAVKSVELIP